nr:valine--tRNA ligase [Buchnera aphidicola]
MEKTYNPYKIERYIQKCWDKNNIFKKDINSNKKFFCIMMPPPNITGSLHMGHAFQQAIMDSLIRYNYMLGKNVLFQLGTDHAGIATQMVVENYLLTKKGRKRDSYSRKEFIKEILNWKKKFESNIFYQVKRLGNFINVNDSRFTLDKNFSKAVKKVFILLYKDNYIYKSKKLVYWDPSLKTVVSDLEVEHRTVSHNMWYIKYLLVQKKHKIEKIKYLIVSTTRPETLLGDTAIAVHPRDIRYKKYIGRFVLVPIIGRVIPIISDYTIDMNKGTGCMKITPAHDFNDYNIAKIHKLPMINIFTFDGKILDRLEIFNQNGSITYKDNIQIPDILKKLDRFIARKKILSMLKEMQYLKKIEIYNSSIPYGDRSGIILEPMLTNQWYLKTKKLANTAIEMVKKRKVLFLSQQYLNMYLAWMNNVEDWCISRQIWWGHQIPIWYDNINNNVYVGKNEKSIRKEYLIPDSIVLTQDTDVLDTWFSSSLWTFAGLGWPSDKKKIKNFHPTNILVSGFDIIFFWIARMIMITTYVMKKINNIIQVPFKKLYITGLIKDEEGKKMSKSRGNTLDPLDLIDGIKLSKLIEKRTHNLMQPKLLSKIISYTKKQFPNGIESHGADALRLTLLSLVSTSRNIHWDMNRLKGYKYFCNKLWNASRFIFLNMTRDLKQKKLKKSFLDLWIILKLNIIIKNYHIFFKKYRFDKIVSLLYKFIWRDFCDYYLETIKPILNTGSNQEVESVKYTLFVVFSSIIRLLHPIAPFITDMLWENFNKLYNRPIKSVLLESFPIYKENQHPLYLFKFIKWIQKVSLELRSIRIDIGVRYNFSLQLYIKCFSMYKRIFIEENYNFLKKTFYVKNIVILFRYTQTSSSIYRIVDDTELFIPLSHSINIKTELLRLNKSIVHIQKFINKINKTLKNESFIKYAPKTIVLEKIESLKKNNIIFDKLIQQKNFYYIKDSEI